MGESGEEMIRERESASEIEWWRGDKEQSVEDGDKETEEAEILSTEWKEEQAEGGKDWRNRALGSMESPSQTLSPNQIQVRMADSAAQASISTPPGNVLPGGMRVQTHMPDSQTDSQFWCFNVAVWYKGFNNPGLDKSFLCKFL